MLVFSERRRVEEPRVLVAALRRRLATALLDPSPDAMTTLLIEAGALESAVADALQPDADDAPCLAATLSAVTLDLAHAERGDRDRLSSAARWLDLVAQGALPARVELTEPEGFAFYALYPATYRLAARRLLASVRPDRVAVLGLRTIGTTLAAVVASETEAAGLPTQLATARPRGHPWNRELRLGPCLARWLEEAAQGHTLIVDEGPGLSGTSFAAAAEAASQAGASDGRIHLMPSWDSDGSGFRSPRAKARWGRHQRWAATFEEAVLPSLASSWGGGTLRDLSGGQWRDLLPPGAPRPSTQPQHERRKYLFEGAGAPPILLKFAGLGTRGARALQRAREQAEAGLAPPALGLRDGFLALRWVGGTPQTAIAANALPAVARHLAHIASQEPQGPIRFDDAIAMTRLAAREGLGEEAEPRTRWMDRMRAAVSARPAVAVDGRMLPTEWVRSGGALLKCDGLDHHDDHFWPGCQDVAWDLAGAMVEASMPPADRAALLDRFEALSGDRGARAVLQFHEAAYLAWRLGYAALAAETLGASSDGISMAAERDRYAGLLRAALDRGASCT